MIYRLDMEGDVIHNMAMAEQETIVEKIAIDNQAKLLPRYGEI